MLRRKLDISNNSLKDNSGEIKVINSGDTKLRDLYSINVCNYHLVVNKS
jgi:hypothetical protein